jgi:hypothetical protein
VTDYDRPLAGSGPRGHYEMSSDRPQPANLADILERVLDKGIVIAGDIKVNLLDIELLTIKIRLLVASVERAREMGIDWWENDPMLTTGRRRQNGERGDHDLEDGRTDASGSASDDHELEEENRRLRARLQELEARSE